MKDNKKVIIIVVSVIAILLICLLGIRHCEKQDKVKDEEIKETSKDKDTDNNNDEDYIDEVVEQEAMNNQVTSKPTISLNGSDVVYVEINSTYKDAGAIAKDEKYGDLTKNIQVTNSVDLSKLGTYTITYTITNKDNEVASITRTVVVVDTKAPIIKTANYVVEGEPVFIDANKSLEFAEHAINTEDNSKGNITLEIKYFYRANIDDEMVEVDKLDLSTPGYYTVYYKAIDESGNKTEDTVMVEYQVGDILGPDFTLSMNGNDYPMVNPVVTVSAEDAYTNVVSFEYAWVTSVDETPVYATVTNGTTLTPNNGTSYLYLRATDSLGNESEFVSNAFQKDDTLFATSNFNLHSGLDYSGVNAGVIINQLQDITDIQSVVVKLYSNNTLLATNTSTAKIYELALNNGSIELSTPFIVNNGTYVEEYWTTVQNTAYNIDLMPTKVVFEITKSNGQIDTIENNNLVEPGIYWEGNFYDYDILVGETRGNYSNIKEAIDNAPAGARILVLPGNYDGNLTINKNITIFGLDKQNTTITTTTAPITRVLPNSYGANPVIYVENSTLDISNITITSNLNQYTAIDGITVNNGDLYLNNVVITNIKNIEGFSGVQYGRGVTAYGTSNININNTHINNFNKNGAHFVGNGVTANITNSTFIGAGKNTSAAAQNGVVYMNGANGSITNSVFANFQYHDTTVAEATGILLYNNASGNVQIATDNIFSNCDVEVETA